MLAVSFKFSNLKEELLCVDTQRQPRNFATIVVAMLIVGMIVCFLVLEEDDERFQLGMMTFSGAMPTIVHGRTIVQHSGDSTI